MNVLTHRTHAITSAGASVHSRSWRSVLDESWRCSIDYRGGRDVFVHNRWFTMQRKTASAGAMRSTASAGAAHTAILGAVNLTTSAGAVWAAGSWRDAHGCNCDVKHKGSVQG